jgi:Fe-S cluster biogenesis protein NfuA
MTKREYPVQARPATPALATIREVGFQPPVFTARYPGTCGGCGSEIDAGDTVFYDGDTLVGDGCCAGDSTLSAEARTTIAQVMPRGKSVKDRCSKCFQIPASNGACGCDS